MSALTVWRRWFGVDFCPCRRDAPVSVFLCCEEMRERSVADSRI